MEEERYGRINATGDDRPLLKNLHDHVVQKVAHKWYDLGVQLLRPDQQETLRIIELDHPRDTVVCCKCVFEKWLDTATDATWNQLISALRSPTVELDYLANQIENMMVVEMEATTSSSSGEGIRSRFTTIEEMEVEFAIMTNNLKRALIDNNTDVHSLIEQLRTISAVRSRKVPLFDEDVFLRIRSVDEFWKSLSTYWSIYDYDLLRFIIRITKCGEAKRILEEFLSRIDPSAISDVDLVLHYRVDQREGSLMPTLRIKVNAEKCTYNIQQKVKKIVSKKFDLEEYAFQFKGIKDGCIELLYHVSKPVKSYLLQYTIDEGSLTKFSTYKIISIHIDDIDLFKWSIAPHLLAVAPDNLKCPECHEVFKQAKYLPCYHSYCEHCLEKMQVQSRITCPKCRKEAILPSGGVKKLEDNFFINRLVDEFILKCKVESEAGVKCEECSEVDPAVTFCLNCTIFLCHVCNEHHRRSNKFRGHAIIPLTELRSKRYTIQLKSKPLMCREHNTELLLYCETCDQLVCIYCVVENHFSHRHDVVKKAVDKHKQELKNITAPVEEMIRGLSDTHDNIEKMMRKILQQGGEVNKKIDQHYDRVIQQLMAQKEQLKQQVYDALSQKEKAVATKLEEIDYAKAEVLSIKQLNDAVKKSSDQEVLSVKKQLIDRMKKITDKYNPVYLPLVQPDIMKFVPTNDVLPWLGSVCSTASPDPRNCEIVDLPKYSIKGKRTKFTIITKDKNGDKCSEDSYSEVSVQLGGVNDIIQVRDGNDGSYMASYIPQQVGEVKLSVLISGQQIKGSPYSVTVKDYTSVNNPSKIVSSDGIMGKPWGIAFGKNGMWAVADYSKHLVHIFDGDDRLVRILGGLRSDNQFHYPAGVAFDSDGCLYVVDSANHMIQSFTPDGKHLLKFGSEGSGDGELKFPNGLTIYNGKAYVSDHGNKRISVFQTDGVFNCNFGSGQLGKPHDITVNNDQLLIADHDHHCIYRFTLDGKYVGKFGIKGNGVAQFDNPFGVSVDLYGFILVADTWNHRVSVYDKDGIFIHCFGSMGSANGQFQHPYGVAVSANGNICVSDHSNRRIQIFSNLLVM